MKGGANKNSIVDLSNVVIEHALLADAEPVVELINSVYRKGEHGILEDSEAFPLVRVTLLNIQEWVAAKQLYVARRKENTHGGNAGSAAFPVIGCIKVQIGTITDKNDKLCNKKVGFWGCFGVDQAFQGLGVGRLLVEFAEGTIRKETSWAQIELLKPRDWQHDHKERLLQWYMRMGYTEKVSIEYISKNGTFGCPGSASFRALTDSEIIQYRKKLSA